MLEFKYIVMEEGYEPSSANAWDAGLDLRVQVPGGSMSVYPGCEVKLGLRVKFAIPKGYVGLVISRSGLDLQLHNSVGVIDAGYQGELFIRLRNPRDTRILVEDKQRVAQLVVVPLSNLSNVQVESFDEVTERGESGFHSSGKF